MNAVIYYSNTGQSKGIAEYFSEQTSFPLLDVCQISNYSYDTVVLVFPVHCQNVPKPVKSILSMLTVRALIPIATYGKMCYGNVLYEIQKRYRHNITAAAYVPAKHAYLSGSDFSDYDKLSPILDKIGCDRPITVPKSYKNPFADIFPTLRSRMGVKLNKDDNCNNCGVCSNVCYRHAINNGKTNSKCIRCLRCVEACPNGAIHYSLRLPMKLYLRKNKCDRLLIYV